MEENTENVIVLKPGESMKDQKGKKVSKKKLKK
jgi:hypothetical protein